MTYHLTHMTYQGFRLSLSQLSSLRINFSQLQIELSENYSKPIDFSRQMGKDIFEQQLSLEEEKVH